MAVRIPDVLERTWIRTEGLLERLQMTRRAYHYRVIGQTPWGEQEVDDVLAWLHDLGRQLRALRRSDLVDPGTVLRPRDRRLLRPARTPRPRR